MTVVSPNPTDTDPIAAVTPATPRRLAWPLYAVEAALLGCFMVSACLFVTLLEHPASPLNAMLPSPVARRALIGLAMGLTAVALIYSPWGKRSGALMNPSMTLSVLRLGKLTPRDAAGYVVAQFLGATAGVGTMTLVARAYVAHPSVHYVATVPGDSGVAAAWVAEFLIAFVLVCVVFRSNGHPRLARATGLFAGALVAVYIALVAPVSGMSMNPARTFGSAFWAHVWRGWWVYFTAPVLGMLAGTELHRRLGLCPHRLCARLTHDPTRPSHFRCDCLRPDASDNAADR